MLFLVLLIAAASPPVRKVRFFEMGETELQAELAKLHRQWAAAPARVAAVSEGLLGARYAVSPLGEGPGRLPDPDPLMRLDAVDCLTYVEETLALALSVTLEEAAERLRCIRYLGGEVDYLKRKHFMVAQWLPDNQRLGFLKDLTEEIGGREVVWVSKTLDAQAWKRRRAGKNWPLLDADQIPQGHFRLPVIPLEKAEKFLHLVPTGSIMLVVRRDDPDYPVLVSHLGFMIRKEERLFLRHASSRAGKVVEEDFLVYLGKVRRYRRWPVSGLNWQLPLDGRDEKMSQEVLEQGFRP